MEDSPFKATLIDYDEDLFAPPNWMGEELARDGIVWVVGQYRSPEAALEAARASDVVMIQSVRPLLTRTVIERLERLRCIVRLGTGYDNVDVTAATERGILVCNTPTYCVDDVADHALALLMDGVRHIARQDRLIRAGRWDRTTRGTTGTAARPGNAAGRSRARRGVARLYPLALPLGGTRSLPAAYLF